jgi:two-component system, LytTR family, sensor histidine kinase AlgZ
MHPLLAGKDRLGLYLLAWVPLAALLARMLTAGGELSWTEAATIILPLAAIYAFVCLSAWYVCRFVPIGPAGIPRLLLANLAAAALSSGLWVMAGRALAAALGLEAKFERHVLMLFGVGVLLYLLAAALHYVLLAVEASQQAREREMQARILAREAELRALKAQINPHFLFNSLHSIAALAGAEPERAREMCALLSDFLRASLGLGERESVPLGEELALANRFLAVEQVRFGSRLRVEERVEADSKECPVPPLLLQPLVENAVRHGIATLVEGGAILIEARRLEGGVSVAVENTFDESAPARRANGLGLANVRKRLEARYGTAARLDVSISGGRYRVEVLVPVEAEAPR